MSYGDYARLGATCCTNMNVLLSNAKFIPLNDPVYNVFYTNSPQYPGSDNRQAPEDREEQQREAREERRMPFPEDIKLFPRKQCCQK